MSDTHKKELEEKDAEIASLKVACDELAGHIDELLATRPIPPKDPVTLSADEMRQVLLTQVRSLVHENGSVYNKQDQGVYCQINRPGVDGSLHIYVQVPEEFVLDQYTPPTE